MYLYVLSMYPPTHLPTCLFTYLPTLHTCMSIYLPSCTLTLRTLACARMLCRHSAHTHTRTLRMYAAHVRCVHTHAPTRMLRTHAVHASLCTHAAQAQYICAGTRTHARCARTYAAHIRCARTHAHVGAHAKHARCAR